MYSYEHSITPHERYVNILKNKIIHGGYLTALGAPSLILTTSKLTDTHATIPLLLISYLLPLIVYSYDYHHDVDKDDATNSERARYLKKDRFYPFILVTYLVLLILLILLFSSIHLTVFIVLIVLGGIFYATLFKRITKKIPLFKNLYTVLTWSLSGTFFIPLYYSMGINSSLIISFIFITLKGMVNAVFFDLKDCSSDKEENLKTLPVLFGKENAVKFLHILNFAAFIPLIIGVYLKIIPSITLSLIIFYFYTEYYLKKSCNNLNNKSWTNLCSIADSEFILWAVFLVVLQTVF
ncbi:UbiA family prenyltransferase [Methanobacterium aggregans]|uniref:UbiA family prenyltransferase n=1 Tax=Methanobacterium aggregans TaxID=1615586 RepID=UPI00320C8469